MLQQINPNKLFLLDSIGALLTLVLCIILAKWESLFGMPAEILFRFCGIAGLFCIYSFSCFWIKMENWRIYMKIIAIANLLYACLTMAFVVYYYEKLTNLGLVYFVSEFGVICFLAGLEMRVAMNYEL